ncbi:hypothetical protein [Caulobacter sp. 17J80-11]|uniref:hypothetical protein n=1 Tax=Caulobacter sp. 17J80-11 TaxID=2763502 RepID=UPI001653D6C9|nr:hypothetical protein [Caulobacter sp. 17J80-11]MBC6980200.1 hypothetical protein [Caulobacter sp. 17J80-11]
MWITIAVAVFGALVGLCVHNRAGALFISCTAVVLSYLGMGSLTQSWSIYLNSSAAGRRIAADLEAIVGGGLGALYPMLAAAAAGALITAMVMRAQGGSREWDPDRPRKRKRRAAAPASSDSRIDRILNDGGLVDSRIDSILKR